MKLVTALEMIERANCPEDLFGKHSGSAHEIKENVAKAYRPFAMATHEDRTTGEAANIVIRANAAFKRLGELRHIAEAKIDIGTYGDMKPTAQKFAPISITMKKHAYTLIEQIAEGDIADIFLATIDGGTPEKVVIKIVRDAGDNDLMENEARVLQHLFSDKRKEAAHYQRYLPRLIESCKFGGKGGPYRQANAFSFFEGYFTLADVKREYPEGLDARTIAWMWKRILEILQYVHYHNVVHGAIIPTHLCVHPKTHGLGLLDHAYALIDPTASKQYIRAISEEYRSFYPPEVFAKKIPCEGTDIYMAARSMIDVAGGKVVGEAIILPDSIPKEMQAFLKACASPLLTARRTSAFDLLDEFNRLLANLYGPPQYHEFFMPKPKK